MTATVAVLAGTLRLSRLRVARQFRDAGALSPATAIAFSPERHMDLRSFERMERDGALKPADGGRFWLDETGLEAADRRRRSNASRAVAIMMSLVAVAVLLVERFGHSLPAWVQGR